MLVGCGAAGAIAGAFGAPLGGAFYAFELVIGSYSVTSLAPVGIAALVGYLVANLFNTSRLGIGIPYVMMSPDMTWCWPESSGWLRPGLEYC